MPKQRKAASGRKKTATVDKGSAALAFVVAEFHGSISDAMLAAARDEAAALGARVAELVDVPGCYEAPLIVSELLTKRNIDAVVVLGFIERGETLHGEVMGHVVHRTLVEAGIYARKPVGLGIIGPGATLQQAKVRKEASARAAVRAVMRSLEALRRLSAATRD